MSARGGNYPDAGGEAWYPATGGVRLDDLTEVALRDLVRAPALAGGRFVRLPTGDYVEVEQRLRRVVAALALGASETHGAKGELAVHPAAIATLQEVSAPESGFEVDDDVAVWLARFARASTSRRRPA